MKKLLPFLAIVLCFGQLSAQKSVFWKKVSESDVKAEKIRTTTYSEKQQLLQIDVNAVRQTLASASNKFSGSAGVIIDFPGVNGKTEKYQVWENSNFDQQLQAQYPDIRAFSGKSVTNDGTSINFSLSPSGIQTMVLKADGSSEFIEPYTKDNSAYVLFDSKTRNTGKLPFTCSTKEDAALNKQLLEDGNITRRASNQSYKTMRLALSCTGEYTTFYGGTVAGALAGMNATMTRVNGVLEKDMALHLNIIAGNSAVIFTNANTDPYSNADVGTAEDNVGTAIGWNVQLQKTLTSLIGNSAYDIGHLFGASGGGGNAGCIGCVCEDDTTAELDQHKGSGFTSPSSNIPQGDTFDIDYVIHEMGHQLGANHTFSYNVESGTGVNVEPGSGSTIMGYAGITDYDVQSNSDAYFTYRSILQMQTNLATKTCPVSTPIANTPPVITPLVDFTLPKGTPFILKGNATDAEGDVLTYCWEQNNNAPSNQAGANSVAFPTKTTGPNYRSFTPVSTPNRYMPAYASVLAGTLSTQWESVSTVQRSSRYTLTVRDNNPAGSQTSTDDVTVVTSVAIGPFQLTSPAASAAWKQGTAQTVTWDVNGSNTLPGAELVNIKLSTDGGITFPYVLAENVTNDGSQDVTVPEVTSSSNCRILIEPTNNVFYTIGAAPFFIGYELVSRCITYAYDGAPFSIPDGSTSYTIKTLTVPPTDGTVTDVNIAVNITHANLQNLRVGVIKPTGGGLATLFNQQCSGNANLDVVFDSQAPALVCGNPTQGAYAPSGFNLSTYNGIDPRGVWQFGFRDSVAGTAGTVNSFSLEICTQAVQLATQDVKFENFALYPNPNNGSFTVQFNSGSGNKINIAVHDISGRMIFDKVYESAGLFSQNLQLSKAQSGIYLVSITDGDKKIVKRIVVQ